MDYTLGLQAMVTDIFKSVEKIEQGLIIILYCKN